MGKRVLLTLAAALAAAPFIASGGARAASPTPHPTPAAAQGVFQNTYYSNADIIGAESEGYPTVRIVNDSGSDLCALIYVTDKDQEMKECCGCLITNGGTDILGVSDDLTNNPANGVPTINGSIGIISSAASACNPSAPKVTPQLEAWSTHYQITLASGTLTEDEFTALPLSSAAQSDLVAECAAIQLIGSGKGICTCGSGEGA